MKSTIAATQALALGMMLATGHESLGVHANSTNGLRGFETSERNLQQDGFTTCSNTVFRLGGQVTQGACTSFRLGRTYVYPDDFGGVLNRRQWYTCPDSGLRILESNGVPDHTVTQANPRSLCEQNYQVRMPLNPTFSGQITEPSAAGIIAMSLNGVPAFGAQESGGTNAAEPLSTSNFPGVEYYGHTAADGNWHYHSGEFGLTSDISTIPSDQLLGFAVDGFPIHGPVTDSNMLDACGGIGETPETYRYHVRLYEQINDQSSYCDNDSPAVQWGYVLGCYKGSLDQSSIFDSSLDPLPSDCVADDPTSSTPAAPSTPEPTPSPAQAPPGSQPTDPNAKYSFIVMQPDDFEFYEPWMPPPHIRRNAALDFPPGGLPNIERLRVNGLQMKQAYTASAMCGTSRYSTMTGRYPSRSSYGRNLNAGEDISTVTIPSTKLQDTETVDDGDDCSLHNLAALMKENGYRTGMIGKWHLWRTTRQNYSYEAIQAQIKACGFEFAEGIYAENLGSGWTNNGPEFSHNMEWITEHAVNFIKNSTSDDPFFLYFNPSVPHGSGNVFLALTDFSCTQTPEGLLENEPAIPGMTEGVGCDAYRQTVIERAQGSQDNEVLGSIWVDDGVGAILKALEDSNQLENTFFLFQMDHGQEGKGSLYEPGNRLAQFVHFPAKFSGQAFDGMVSTIDIGPTIMEYAGINESSPGYYPMDGESWATALTATEVSDYFEDDRCLFFEMDTDRAVVCGRCDKMIHIVQNTALSSTYAFGQRRGQATASETLLNLCDENGEYETSVNKETSQSTIADPIMGARLRELLKCHTDRTDPDITPDYSVECGPQLDVTPAPTPAAPAPTTSAPVVSLDPNFDENSRIAGPFKTSKLALFQGFYGSD